jgi:hypothetical protein
MRLQVYDSGSNSYGQLGDTLAKAFFGDPEAASKVALARAQIASQGAYAGNLEAEAEVNRQKLAEAQAQQRAREAAAGPLSDLAISRMAPPAMVEAPRPAPNFQGPMPEIVDPVAKSRYDTEKAAMPAIVQAILSGGGNAQELAKAVGITSGMAGLLEPSATTVRPSSTLYTGSAPSQTDQLGPTDVSGVQAQIAVNAAKPQTSQEKTIIINGRAYTRENDPAGGPDKLVELSGQAPAPAAPAYPGTGNEAQDKSTVFSYADKVNRGIPTTPQEDLQYGLSFTSLYGRKDEIREDPVTHETFTVPIQPEIPPGLPVPKGWKPSTPAAAAVTPAPAAAASPAGPPAVNPPAAAAGGGPSFPLPATPSIGTGLPIAGAQPVQAPTSIVAPTAPAASATVPPAATAAAPPAAASTPTSLAAAVGAAGSAPTAPAAPPAPAAGAGVQVIRPGRTTSPTTQEQDKGIAYYGESYINNAYLDRIGIKDIPTNWQLTLADPSREGYFGRAARAAASGKSKSFQDAADGFVNGYLRLQSGAVLRPEEIATFSKRYIPEPGDDEVRLEEKRVRRQMVMEALHQIGQGTLPMVDGAPSMKNIDAYIDKHANELISAVATSRSNGLLSGGPVAPPGGAAPPAGGRIIRRLNPNTQQMETVNG